jgi:hypothetical protein
MCSLGFLFLIAGNGLGFGVNIGFFEEGGSFFVLCDFSLAPGN